MRRSASGLAFASALCAAGASSAAAPVTTGTYDGELCVATSAAAPLNCGAAEVSVGGQQVAVRVSDIVYRLELHARTLDVVTTHERVQIDEFSAAYDWVGRTLRFGDPARDTRYEVRLGKLRPAAR